MQPTKMQIEGNSINWGDSRDTPRRIWNNVCVSYINKPPCKDVRLITVKIVHSNNQ